MVLLKAAQALTGRSYESIPQVIEAATLSAAIGCGIADQTGHLSAGKAADIIAVDGNPIESLDALRRIVMVMKAGNIVRLKRNLSVGA